jgi:hypothetical protein
MWRDGRTDGRTDAFRNFANAPKKRLLFLYLAKSRQNAETILSAVRPVHLMICALHY